MQFRILTLLFSLLKFIHKALYYVDVIQCFQALLNVEGQILLRPPYTLGSTNSTHPGHALAYFDVYHDLI